MRFRQLRALFMLALVFPRELWRSGVAVLRAALARQPQVNPRIIAMPLEVRTDAAVVALANLITLTPGTTTLHASQDSRQLFIHCLQAVDEDEVIAGIRHNFERWLLELEA